MFPFTRTRRQRLKERPFPASWQAVLTENFPLYLRLSPADQEELHGHIQIFLAEKIFEGVNGQEMNDQVRLTIASQACLMLLHRETDYYPAISSIIVYPGEFVAPWQELDESGIMVEGDECRAGEFAGNGALALSWEDVLMSGVDDCGSYNVVLHEFAHQIDEEYGITAGGRLFSRREGRGMWNRTLEREYHKLQHDAAHRRSSVFDHYGAESPTEFFAVVTESFFENPLPFRMRHPELYNAMSTFFHQDPASWPVIPNVR